MNSFKGRDFLGIYFIRLQCQCWAPRQSQIRLHVYFDRRVAVNISLAIELLKSFQLSIMLMWKILHPSTISPWYGTLVLQYRDNMLKNRNLAFQCACGSLFVKKLVFHFHIINYDKIVLLQRNVAIRISIRCCRLYPVSGFEFGFDILTLKKNFSWLWLN